MKTCLGLTFILLSTLCLAESGTRRDTLLLRGRVPASVTLEWDEHDLSKGPEVKTNFQKSRPTVVISDTKNQRKITIIHP